MDILKYNPEAEVYSPVSLRNLVHEKLQNALSKYNGGKYNQPETPTAILYSDIAWH